MFKLKNTGSGEIFYATTLSAGFDICARENITIASGSWSLVKTGLFIEETIGAQEFTLNNTTHTLVPEIQIRPRSGLAAKFGITVLNSPSTIDADYRGEMMVNIINHGKNDFEIKSGDRIAQGVCSLVAHIPNVPVKKVERGSNGFGSTGI